MKTDDKKGNTSAQIIEGLVQSINCILSELKISVWIAGLIILVQFFQLSIIMMEFDSLELSSTYSGIFYYFNLIAPYKLIGSFSMIVALIISGISLLFIVALIYGFVSIHFKSNPSTTLKKIYGLFLYFFEYVLFLPILGALTSIYSLPNNLSDSQLLAFQAVFGVCLIVLGVMYFAVVLFFFNFLLRSKDALARSPSLTHFFFKILFVLLTVIDVLIGPSNFKIKEIINLIVTVVLCIDFIRRVPYYNYEVSLFYLFGVFAFFWVNLLVIFVSVFNVKLVRDNILVTMLVGVVLFIWNIYGYKKYLFNSLISKDFTKISNNNLLEKKIRYFLVLIKNSKKNIKDELKLASIVQLHVESCKTSGCICKNRAMAYDPKKRASADMSQLIFKDFVFLKNLVLFLIKETSVRLFTSPNLNLVFILYLFEELCNFGMANQECIAFVGRFKKPTQFMYKYSIMRIQILMKNNLKRFNKQFPFALNKFENVLEYDRSFDDLK